MIAAAVSLLRMHDSPGIADSSQPNADAIASLRKRVLDGDIQAFDLIVTAHQRQILTAAWRMLGNGEDARDAAQEVFIRAFRHLRSYRPDRSFGAWLYSILVNVCRDAWRRKKRQRWISLETEEARAAAHKQASPQDSQEDLAVQQEGREWILRALRGLPEKQRLVLVLKDFEGLETEEIAGILDTRSVTVRSHLSLARTRIREAYERFSKKAVSGGGT